MWQNLMRFFQQNEKNECNTKLYDGDHYYVKIGILVSPLPVLNNMFERFIYNDILNIFQTTSFSLTNPIFFSMYEGFSYQ